MVDKWIAQLPKTWQQITLSQWIELKQLEQEDLFLTDFQIERICVLLDIDNTYFDDIDLDELQALVTACKFIDDEIPPSTTLRTFKPFTLLTFGEYIDIVEWSKDYEQYPNILALLYRELKKDEWGNVTYEPYKYDVFARGKAYLDEPITQHYGVLDDLNRYLQHISESYPNIFIEDEPIDTKYLDEDEARELIEEVEHEKKNAPMTWAKYADSLADGCPIKELEIYELPLIYVLNKITQRLAKS